MELAVRPHIMSERERVIKRDIPPGTTIQQAIDQLEFIDPRVRQLNLAVFIDGYQLGRDHWADYTITGDEKTIEISAVLMGGGRGKQIMALIATIAVSVVAGPLAAGLTGMTSGVGFAAAKFGIMMIGALAINSIFAPPRIDDNTKSGGDTQNAYTFGSQANSARHFGPIMRVYGRHRVRPDIAAVPYTLNVGDDQFFHCVYCFGYGPLRLEDFRIGTNPITNYKDYDLIIHERFTHASQLQIYKQDVWQDGYNAEIKHGAPALATTQADVDEAIVDIMFPQGLGRINDKGGTDEYETTMLIEYAIAGTSAFTPAQITYSSGPAAVQKTTGQLRGIAYTEIYDPYNMHERTTWRLDAGSVSAQVVDWGNGNIRTVYSEEGVNIRDAGTPVEPGTIITIGPYKVTVIAATTTAVTWAEPLPGMITGDGAGLINFTHDKPLAPNSAGAGQLFLKRAKRGSFIVSAGIKFPTLGQWTVRVSKNEPEIDPDSEEAGRVLTDRSLVALKSLRAIAPLAPEVPLTVVELRIKANGQLNSSVEEFSAIANSILPVWENGEFVERETRNPAWIYLDLLSGTANPRRLPYSRIDIEKIKEWATYCNYTGGAPFVEPTGTCDVVVNNERTLWEMLQSVATTGRATPTMRDNLYSVLIDDESREPVQMFTPRNSWNLRSTRTYVDPPHALRVKWIDPSSDYRPADIIVYNTGYNVLNATKFEELATFGMTRVEQVTRYGRYMLAQGLLRLERFTIQTDIENIVCTRGDMVLVAHDVIEVGGEASRVASRAGNRIYVDTGITLFDLYEQGVQMGVRFRTSDGELSGVFTVSVINHDEGWIDLLGILPANLAAGDLMVYGRASAVTGQYVVDKIVPNNDLGATIHLEEFAPGVFEAERTGIIPPYSPQGGGSYLGPPPRNLEAKVVEYKENGHDPYCVILLTWAPPENANLRPPEHYRIWAVDAAGQEEYFGEVRGLSFTDGPVSLWRFGGSVRIYRVRAYHPTYGLSNPAEDGVLLPPRDMTPPPPPDNFEVQALTNGMRKYNWSYDLGTPEGWAGVIVRYIAGSFDSPSWELMSQLQDRDAPLTQNGFETAWPPGAGPFTFAARTIDITGSQSDESTFFQITLPPSALDGGPISSDLTPPPTPNPFTVDGGIGTIYMAEPNGAVYNAPYTQGGGHDFTRVYGAIYNGGPLPTFDEAEVIGSYKDQVAALSAEPGVQYYLWIKWVSKAGVESLLPWPWVNSGMMVRTAYDPGKLIDAIEGLLNESHLAASLNSRIDLIDGNLPGSVNDRINEFYDLANTQITAEANARKITDTHLLAQYTVKVDINGYVVGYGLAAEVVDGQVRSEFAVRADKFYIASPGGGIRKYPFIVYAVSGWYLGPGGESVFIPAGVYMDAAFIRNATITTAMIGQGQIHNAKIGNLITSIGFNGSVTDSQNGNISSDGTIGWGIDKTGRAVFNTLRSRRYIDSDSGYVVSSMASALHIGTIPGNLINTNANMQLFGPAFHYAVPQNRRLRGSTGDNPSTIMVQAYAQVDHYFTLWCKINNGNWFSVATLVEPQESYGTAALGWVLQHAVGWDTYISFGVSASNTSLAILDGSKHWLNYLVVAVQATNI